MTTQDVKQVVIDIIADIAPDEDLSVIKEDVSLREQLDLDSMDFLDIVMELRKRHRVEVPADDYPRLATLASCVEYLTPKFIQ
ncbi:MAG: acyl carrier protein [Bacteriovoracaceae bacterium]|nr:acyl carrier protein [Bacteriovoracaceae bacterium]